MYENTYAALVVSPVSVATPFQSIRPAPLPFLMQGKSKTMWSSFVTGVIVSDFVCKSLDWNVCLKEATKEDVL